MWTPGWWYLTLKSALKEHLSTSDGFHYENLNMLTQKIIKMWSNCSSNWVINSFNDLFSKTSACLGSTYRTCLPSTVTENVISSMIICSMKEPLSLETCSDSALIQIMSTLCTPVASPQDNASVTGAKRSHSQTVSNLDIDFVPSSLSGPPPTTSSVSYISSLTNNGKEKRGFKEDVKDLKIIVSILLSYVYRANIHIAVVYLQMQVYNGRQWKQKLGNYWTYQMKKVDMTFDLNSPMHIALENFLDSAEKEMDSKPWVHIEDQPTFSPDNHQQRGHYGKQNGKPFQGRYQPYFNQPPYAHWKG